MAKQWEMLRTRTQAARRERRESPTATAVRIVQAVDQCIGSLRLYGSQHPITAAAVSTSRAAISGEMRAAEVQLTVADGVLLSDGRAVSTRVTAVTKLVKRCEERDIGTIVFCRGFDDRELGALIGILTADPSDIKELGGPAVALSARGAERIRIEQGPTGEDEEDSEDERDARRLYDLAIRTVEDSMEQARLGTLRSVGGVRTAARMLIGAIVRDSSALLALTTIQRYDIYTFAHSVNVGILSLCLGAEFGMTGQMLEMLGVGALLHDIGKTTVPKEILLKPGELTSEEFETVRRHPEEGARLLQKIPAIGAIPPLIAYEHHMALDGSGYPERASGYKISEPAQIACVVDRYDAMTSVRPYRNAFPPDKALQHMSALAGQEMDRRVTLALVGMLGIYPAGCCVRLNTNEIAVVVQRGIGDVRRPCVAVVLDPEGDTLEEPTVIDLGAPEPVAQERRIVVGTVDGPTKGIDVAEVLKQTSTE
ncbi:MAG: HD-GYP domain-containing protein [Armatimonadota bacterium]